MKRGRAPLVGDNPTAIGLIHRLQLSITLVPMPDALFVRLSAVIKDGLAVCVTDLLQIAIDELDKMRLIEPAALWGQRHLVADHARDSGGSVAIKLAAVRKLLSKST